MLTLSPAVPLWRPPGIVIPRRPLRRLYEWFSAATADDLAVDASGNIKLNTGGDTARGPCPDPDCSYCAAGTLPTACSLVVSDIEQDPNPPGGSCNTSFGVADVNRTVNFTNADRDFGFGLCGFSKDVSVLFQDGFSRTVTYKVFFGFMTYPHDGRITTQGINVSITRGFSFGSPDNVWFVGQSPVTGLINCKSSASMSNAITSCIAFRDVGRNGTADVALS